MATVLHLDDFETGIFIIPLATKQELVLEEYLALVECEYLTKLFGVELYELFLADLDPQGLPQTQRFIDIYIKFSIQPEDCNYGNPIYTSMGLIEMLKGIVYFLYVRGSFTKLTNNGPKLTDSENSVNIRHNEHDIFTWFNMSVEYWCAIQYRMRTESPDVYPEFRGLGLQRALNF